MSQLLEEILSRENMMRAYKRVVANKGASGVDRITTEEVKEYLIEQLKLPYELNIAIGQTKCSSSDGKTRMLIHDADREMHLDENS